MKKIIAIGILAFCLIPTESRAEGFMSIPGFDFVVKRVRDHGYYGRAWDMKARPVQTMVLAMNDNGPIYVALGAYQDVLDKKWYALGGIQYDALHLWRSASKWSIIKKMGLVKLPSDWKVPAGPMLNGLRTMPNKLRADRDILWNIAIHIPIGKK